MVADRIASFLAASVTGVLAPEQICRSVRHRALRRGTIRDVSADAISPTYAEGERVRYTAAPVFDLVIETGDIGIVDRVDGDWVYAWWPKGGLHSVPSCNVEPAAD